ncbi:acyltransferase family protein [Sphingomonas sp. SORGH_AS_0879]|uniref:acyltransferase family protein n=1 Tax=Sphingomonas sp. SORGH_AS_0879 TaxID=3041790 RepID=UPI002786CB53|nr:heparan-alpha-glucosaminide N-acetyltransferase domain-containing protein [Sphingomonas sp. SORGH_AS_0879]MDQ1231373.1 putative acyltransferase [Sphingomonas sp. SORGH_AS_0879]
MTTTMPKPERFASLDMFRGATIFLMIVVNTAGAGGAFTQLQHAPWFGFTLADLIFPTFLFAVGNAMSFALTRPMPEHVFLRRVSKRAALIFLLGVLMYWFPFVTHQADGSWVAKPFADTRLTGVLQRIALCYLLGSLCARYLRPSHLLWVAIGLVLAHWAILVRLSPAGEAFGRYRNAGTLFDLWLIGPAHLYTKDHGFDPEGLLGTLPATANVIAGYLTGLAIQRWGKHMATVGRLAAIGAGLVIVALLLSPVLPIGKKLWTGSFVALTVGIDLILLGVALWLVEVRGVRFGRSFLQMLGRNPLAIYLFSELLVVALELIHVRPDTGLYTWVGETVFQGFTTGPVGSLLCALAYTLICCAFGWALDRRGIILKV